MNTVMLEGLHDFDLEHIFDCGQCFRFDRKDEKYIGVAGNCTAELSFCEGRLSINEICGSLDWRCYLDLDTDYGEYKKQLSENDEVIKTAISYGEGIRILNQQPWEALISFIISQNNNIPRIKKCIEGLCELFGEKLCEYEGKSYYSFPCRDRLAAVRKEELAPLHLGYRDEYIITAAKSVDEETLCGLRNAPTREAYEYLVGIKGVGPKVANCILLFGLGKKDSFPIDVWVKRVMHELYGFDESDVKGMARFAAERFGSLGGVAQQYLFRYMRWK